VQVAGLADTFDGGDLLTLMHNGEGEAGVDASSVYVDGACSALAVVAALFCAGEMQVLSKAVEKSDTRLDGDLVGVPIDVERDCELTGRCRRFPVRLRCASRSGRRERASCGDDAGSTEMR